MSSGFNKKHNVLALGILLCWSFLFCFSGCEKTDNGPLIIYSGATFREPMLEVLELYQKKYNQKPVVIFSNSRILVQTIKETGKGDIFIPEAEHLINQLGDLILSKELFTAVENIIAIPAPNPGKIKTYKDLTKKGIRIGQTNIRYYPTSRQPAPQSSSDMPVNIDLLNNITTITQNSKDLLYLLIRGDLDAGVIMKPLLKSGDYRHINTIEIPVQMRLKVSVPVAILKTTRNEELARRFTDFMVTQGKITFEKWGFTPL